MTLPPVFHPGTAGQGAGTGRVVLDTNVWVAAGFRPRSASGHIVDEVRGGRVALTWDVATRAETRRIVSRIPPLSWEAIAPLFREEHRFAGPVDAARFAHVPDPEDRKFAALAAAAGAILITMDRDLLDGRAGAAAAIVTPREFLDRAGAPRDRGTRALGPRA